MNKKNIVITSLALRLLFFFPHSSIFETANAYAAILFNFLQTNTENRLIHNLGLHLAS